MFTVNCTHIISKVLGILSCLYWFFFSFHCFLQEISRLSASGINKCHSKMSIALSSFLASAIRIAIICLFLISTLHCQRTSPGTVRAFLNVFSIPISSLWLVIRMFLHLTPDWICDYKVLVLKLLSQSKVLSNMQYTKKLERFFFFFCLWVSYFIEQNSAKRLHFNFTMNYTTSNIYIGNCKKLYSFGEFSFLKQLFKSIIINTKMINTEIIR